MNFSIYQWLLSIVLDFLVKAGCLYLLGSVTLLGAAPFSFFMWMALGLTMFQFLSLSIARGFASLFNLTQATKFVLVLVVANILSVGCLVSIWILSIRSGQDTACSGIEGRCDWIKGDGIQTMAVIALILVVMNLIPILISVAFGCLASRTLKMNFSIHQWLLTFVLDFLLKAGLLFLLGALTLGAAPISLFMSFALASSMFHFFSLFIASGFVALFKFASAAKFALTVLVAETLFIGGASLWTLYLLSQDVSKCPGNERSCPWTDISSQGAQTIVWTALILLVLNLIPIAISAAFGCLARRVRQPLQKNCTTTVVNG